MRNIIVVLLFIYVSACSYNIQYEDKNYEISAISKKSAFNKAKTIYEEEKRKAEEEEKRIKEETERKIEELKENNRKALYTSKLDKPLCYLYKGNKKELTKESITDETSIGNNQIAGEILEKIPYIDRKHFYEDYIYSDYIILNLYGYDFYKDSLIFREDGSMFFDDKELKDCMTEEDFDKKKEVETKKQLDNKIKKYEQEKVKKQDAIYKKYINIPCSTKNWSTYEYGEYFYSIAKKNNITPYDLVERDSYKTRNISSYVKPEILENISKYAVFHLPEELFDNIYELSSLEKQWFNNIVKKHNSCYQRLK